MIRMHLGELARGLGLERRSGDAEFEGISIDSRSLVAGERAGSGISPFLSRFSRRGTSGQQQEKQNGNNREFGFHNIPNATDRAAMRSPVVLLVGLEISSCERHT